MYNTELTTLKSEVEKATGFHCYENSTNNQLVFYGTSDKFEEFKQMIGTDLVTGTIAMLIDTGDSHMYSSFTKTWY